MPDGYLDIFCQSDVFVTMSASGIDSISTRRVYATPATAMSSRNSSTLWSSYHSNAFGKQSKLITPHAEYLALGRTELERLNSYRELFQHHISGDRLKEIQDSLEKGLIYGSDVFKDQIEFNLNRKVRLQKSGRKPKQTLL